MFLRVMLSGILLAGLADQAVAAAQSNTGKSGTGSVTAPAVRLTAKGKLDEKKKKDTKSEGEYYTQTDITITKQQTYNVDIMLQNLSAAPAALTVEWYFIKSNFTREGAVTDGIGEKGARKFNVPGKGNIRHKVVSKPGQMVERIQERESDDDATKTVTYGGSLFKGYVVFVKYGNQVLDKQASDKEFLSEVWLQKILSSVPAA